MVESQMPAAQQTGVDLGVLVESGAALDGLAVKRENSVRGEAVGPTIGILRINRVTLTSAQLLNGEFVDPSLFHAPSFGRASPDGPILCLGYDLDG
jgi:hypothetical protein